jgi:TolA-binding protein
MGSLEGENQQLRDKIAEMKGKIERVRGGMSLQRESHEMQREMYAQQVKKLRETLELQASRSSTRL